jgi:hypothetical protein
MFNGSGTFLISSVGNPVTTATTISSTWANALTADLATGLTTCITRDGQSTPTANIPMGGFKLTGVGLATATGDALSYGRAATVAALTATGATSLTTLSTSGLATLNSLSVTSALTTTLTLTGSASLPALVVRDALETATVSATAATGTIAYYPSTQSVLYYTSNAAANWTLNVTFSAGTTLNAAMATGQSISFVHMVTQGASPFYNNVVQVDGTTSGVTTIWLGSAPTSGNPSGVDVYCYSVLKTGSATFTVLASQSQFK